MSTVWRELSAALHPSDQPPPPTWADCYSTKFAVAHLLQPRRIFEIGVRAGYSALAFLRAVPTARYVGIDSNRDEHGGFCGAIEHARGLLAGYDAMILEMSSAQFSSSAEIGQLGNCDLIHHRWRSLVVWLLVRPAIGPTHRISAPFGRRLPWYRRGPTRLSDVHPKSCPSSNPTGDR